MSCRLSFKKDGLTCRQRCRRAVNEAIWEEVSISWNCERLWIHIMFFFFWRCELQASCCLIFNWTPLWVFMMPSETPIWGGIWLRPPWFVNGWRELDFCFRFEERKHCPLSRWRDSARGIAKPCKDDCCCCCCCVFFTSIDGWCIYGDCLKLYLWWFRIRTSQLWNKDVFPICKIISILLVTCS